VGFVRIGIDGLKGRKGILMDRGITHEPERSFIVSCGGSGAFIERVVAGVRVKWISKAEFKTPNRVNNGSDGAFNLYLLFIMNQSKWRFDDGLFVCQLPLSLALRLAGLR
jgi:hypothetical protein